MTTTCKYCDQPITLRASLQWRHVHDNALACWGGGHYAEPAPKEAL